MLIQSFISRAFQPATWGGLLTEPRRGSSKHARPDFATWACSDSPSTNARRMASKGRENLKTRHADGHTVFGSDDELTLKFEGTCAGGRIARHLGTAEQFPR